MQAHLNASYDMNLSVISNRLQDYAQHQGAILNHIHPSWWGEWTFAARAMGLLSMQSTALDEKIKLNADPPRETIRSSNAIQTVHSFSSAAQYPLYDSTLMQQCAQALFIQAGLSMPCFADFEGEAGYIGALSWAHALQLCRLRALIFRRVTIRRLIDKTSRLRLSEWVDRSTLDKLILLPGGPQLEVLEHAFDLPALKALNTQSLEWEGLHLLSRDKMWDAAGPFAHLRLCFARDLTAPRWIRATLNEIGEIDERFDPYGGKEALELLNI